jgi:hypothetical protein
MIKSVLTSAKANSKLGKRLTKKLKFRLEGAEPIVYIADTITLWRELGVGGRTLFILHYKNEKPDIFVPIESLRENFDDVRAATRDIASFGEGLENG